MKCIYEFDMDAICPVDGTTDTYEVEIESTGMIQVEALLEQRARWRNEAIFQEDLTARLSAAFKASVTTKGIHSGVYVTAHAAWPSP